MIHRDLKPRNLLVNSNCDLKICDFGLARVDDPANPDRAAMSNYIATRWYRAPEVVRHTGRQCTHRMGCVIDHVPCGMQILGRKRYSKAVDMWSVGAILAELIGRKPIFPGRDSFHQMTLICNVLGTPTLEAYGGMDDAQSTNGGQNVTGDYIAALPHKPKVPFSTLYPHASPAACDLLENLLCFEPDRRLSVEQALAHPYLAELHCEEDEPVCTQFDMQEFAFEYIKCSKEDLRGHSAHTE